MKMKLGKKEVVLSKRIAKYALDLQDYMKIETEAVDYLVLARTLSDSLKTTYKNMNIFQKIYNWKYLRFKTKYLLARMNTDDLVLYFTMLRNWEDAEKKKIQQQMQAA